MQCLYGLIYKEKIQPQTIFSVWFLPLQLALASSSKGLDATNPSFFFSTNYTKHITA